MPDLHGWITQQIDRIESAARDATEGPWCADHPEPRHWGDDPESGLIVGGKVLCILDNQYNGPLNADHIVLHDPAAVLRRCEADRRVLARHRLNPNAIWHEAAMCEGCGAEDEMAYPRTENLNDCPELLDLAYAHGLTPELLATLDRPQEGERPDPTPGFQIPDAIYNAYAEMYRQALEATDALLITGNGTGEIRGFLRAEPEREPAPAERAFAILEPHLHDVPLYRPAWQHGVRGSMSHGTLP